MALSFSCRAASNVGSGPARVKASLARARPPYAADELSALATHCTVQEDAANLASSPEGYVVVRVGAPPQFGEVPPSPPAPTREVGNVDINDLLAQMGGLQSIVRELGVSESQAATVAAADQRQPRQ
jgi:hypothetical protein